MERHDHLYGFTVPGFLRQYACAPWSPGAVPGKGGGGTTGQTVEVKTTLDGEDMLERVSRFVPSDTASMWRVFMSPGIMWTNHIEWFLAAGGFDPKDTAQAVKAIKAVLVFNPKHASALGHLILASMGMDKATLSSDKWRHPEPGGELPFNILRNAWKEWVVDSAPGPIRQREVTVDGRSQVDAGSDSGWLTSMFTDASERDAAAQLWITMCQRISIESMDSACDALVGIVTNSTCRVHGSTSGGGSRNPSGFVADFVQASADPTTRGVVGVFTMAPSASESMEPGSLDWLTENLDCVEASVDATTVMIIYVVVWLPRETRLEVMCAPYSFAMTLNESYVAGIPPLRLAPGCLRALLPLIMTHFAVPAQWDGTINQFVAVDYDSHASVAGDKDGEGPYDNNDGRESHDIRKFFDTKSQALRRLKSGGGTKRNPLKRPGRTVIPVGDDGSSDGSSSDGETTKRVVKKRTRVMDDDDDDDDEAVPPLASLMLLTEEDDDEEEEG